MGGIDERMGCNRLSPGSRELARWLFLSEAVTLEKFRRILWELGFIQHWLGGIHTDGQLVVPLQVTECPKWLLQVVSAELMPSSATTLTWTHVIFGVVSKSLSKSVSNVIQDILMISSLAFILMSWLVCLTGHENHLSIHHLDACSALSGILDTDAENSTSPDSTFDSIVKTAKL